MRELYLIGIGAILLGSPLTSVASTSLNQIAPYIACPRDEAGQKNRYLPLRTEEYAECAKYIFKYAKKLDLYRFVDTHPTKHFGNVAQNCAGPNLAQNKGGFFPQDTKLFYEAIAASSFKGCSPSIKQGAYECYFETTKPICAGLGEATKRIRMVLTQAGRLITVFPVHP